MTTTPTRGVVIDKPPAAKGSRAAGLWHRAWHPAPSWYLDSTKRSGSRATKVFDALSGAVLQIRQENEKLSAKVLGDPCGHIFVVGSAVIELAARADLDQDA